MTLGTNTRTIAAAGLALAFAFVFTIGAVAANADEPVARLIEKAALLETSEHDLPGAMTVLEGVTGDERATDDERTQAYFSLGRLHTALGDEDSAMLCMTRAAEGSGVFAARAQEHVDGTAADREAQRARIAGLIHQAKLGGDRSSDARRQIELAGQGAARHIVDAVRRETADLFFVESMIRVLMRIGGSEVARFVDEIARSEDTLMKRFVVESFHPKSAGNGPALVRAFLALLDDPSPAIRLAALQVAYLVTPMAEILEAAGDDAASVRIEALAQLSQRKALGMPTHGDRVVERIRASLAAENMRERQQALHGLSDPSVLTTQSGRRLFLEVLTDASLLDVAIGAKWDPRSVMGKLSSDPFEAKGFAEPDADEVARLAASVTPEIPDTYRLLLGLYVSVSTPRWTDPASLPAILQLIDLGYDKPSYGPSERLSRWIREHAPAAAKVDVARHIAGMSNRDPVLMWLDRQSYGKEDFAPIRDLARAMVTDPPRGSVTSVSHVLMMLAKVPDDRAVAFLVDVAESHPHTLFDDVCKQLLDRDDAAATEAIVKLAKFPADADGTRDDLLLYLFRHGDPRLPGVAHDVVLSGAPLAATKKSFLAKVLVAETSPESRKERIESLYDRVLATHDDRMWGVVDSLLMNVSSVVTYSGFSTGSERGAVQPLVGVIARRLSEAPDLGAREATFRILLSSFVDVPGVEAAARAALRHPTAEVVKEGLEWYYRHAGALDSDEVRMEIVGLLKSPDSAVAIQAMSTLSQTGSELARDALRSMLDHPAADLRSYAVLILYLTHRDEPIDRLLALAADRSGKVRGQVAELLGSTRDERAVTALLDLLADPEKPVRETAKTALTNLRVYHDQVDRWSKWMSRAGFEGKTTLEALLEQASPESSREVRVAAIRSLATVAEPDVLPLIIRMIDDEDPAVAQAAKQAVEDSNRNLRTRMENDPERE